MQSDKKEKKGFTLIEMMIFIFIFSISAITFYKIFSSETRAAIDVKSRLGAVQLANEKIEIIHNLKYEDIGTIGGIPDGKLPQTETVSRSGKTYYVHSSVIAVDDPFDGTLAAGTDVRPADYKQVKIIVYWEDNNPAKSTTAVTSISPPGVEAMYTGGILSLNVVDSSGIGVPNVNVRILNNSVSPAVNVQYTTDDTGNLFLPEVIPSLQTYGIQISKNGYFPAQTYAPYPISTVNPIDVHASVVNASINQKTIIMDKVSTINLHTVSPLGEAIGNIDFTLEGGRQIANTAATPSVPVWSMAKENFNSSTDGKVTLADISPGPYNFVYSNGVQNDKYSFLYLDAAQTTNSSVTFNLSSDTILDANAVLADKELDSLSVTVLRDADGSPIEGASVELKDPNTSYDVTLVTNKFGEAYFPDASAALPSGAYKLNVSAAGFTSITDMDVTINKFTAQEIKMIAE